MSQWREVLVRPERSVFETIRIIDQGSMQIALVVDADNRLLGTVTDGDVRRAVLKGTPLDVAVSTIMNSDTTVGHMQESREALRARMHAKRLRHIPVIDDDGRVIGIELLDDLLESRERENWVVLMAGGLGSRLRPLTDDCPKPMLKVGNQPVLETILKSIIQQGFRHFFISVNYKAEMVKSYFRDGSAWGAHIEYLDEREPMGTAGCLGLLPAIPQSPLFVMNGDLLTKVNFTHLLDFHVQHAAAITMCVREYELRVPYGVVRFDDHHRVIGIDEKPSQRVFVNGGVYVLQPAVLRLLPRGGAFDMPELVQKMIDAGEQASVFPIREYWLDIGQMDDFHRANGDFAEIFS